MGAKNEQTFTMNGSIDKICCILRDPRMSYELKMNIKSETAMPNGVLFQFGHSISMSSWGENITITLSAQTPEYTTVTICSKCAMPTQIVDWGKNKSNVDSIFAFINRCLSYDIMPQQAPVVPQYQQNNGQQTSQGGAFCTNCGAPIQQGGAFCSNCGAKLQ